MMDVLEPSIYATMYTPRPQPFLLTHSGSPGSVGQLVTGHREYVT